MAEMSAMRVSLKSKGRPADVTTRQSDMPDNLASLWSVILGTAWSSDTGTMFKYVPLCKAAKPQRWINAAWDCSYFPAVSWSIV